MVEPGGTARQVRYPEIFSIAAHRGFADALVAGLIPRYREGELGLARLTLLLPSRRAERTVTEAFVRLSQGGLLLPRMAVVGDIDLDETLGPLLDPLGEGANIPAAADPTARWLRLAELLRRFDRGPKLGDAARLRQAFDMGRTIDRLLVEGIDPDALMESEVLGIVGDQAQHWGDSLAGFLELRTAWQVELEARGMLDPPARRNCLFDHAATRWKAAPPAHPVVAAGVTSASPSLAKLLRVVADLPRGAVILPDLDLKLDDKVWDALGSAGQPPESGGPPFGAGDAVTHPQYHLKLLLNRMGVARSEVRPWHRAGMSAAEPERSRAISNLFLPPSASARWVDLPASERRLAGVRLMETAHPGEEAQAIAILIRQALEVPEKRVALITPDRGLAARVIAHLKRWDIAADDTAGRPLSQTAAGRVLLQLADVLAQEAAPVALLALLEHPLVGGEDRPAWLEAARGLDLRLRGPRQAIGLAPLRTVVAKRKNPAFSAWWERVEAILAPLFLFGEQSGLGELLDGLATSASELCGDAVWRDADGRGLASFVEEFRDAASTAGTRIDPAELPTILRDAMDRVAVRPPWGGHPRVAIYGLIEARMSRADLVICGALHEGSWPAGATPDPLLAPAVLRALGVPGGDFRIGLSAHDLAAALGAPEVVLSHARRDSAGPVISSRFVLRVRAMLGKQLALDHGEVEAVRLAQAIDDAPLATPYPRPQPMPSAEQRRVPIAVTGLDRLRGDPYQFYASSILGLRRLDALDAEPTPAWQGTAVHAILDAWHKAGGNSGELVTIAEQELDKMSAHPLMRRLWRPRLLAGLAWVDTETAACVGSGERTVLATEIAGEMHVRGIRIHGRADRIDRMADGNLAIIDYKTGSPPKPKMVIEGFALQLGLIGLIARGGGFNGIQGEPERFEYWSLAREKTGANFGYVREPIQIGRKSGVPREQFLSETERYLNQALDRWILGSEPFTARLNPDLPSYADYDQLMRLDEWLPRLGHAEADGP